MGSGRPFTVSLADGKEIFKGRACWEPRPDGVPLKLTRGHPVAITEKNGWTRLDYKKDITPGSALDFSQMGLLDAPAGKHGWLKAVGGHFEFEGTPGVEQRFYGVNLCFTANYLEHEGGYARGEGGCAASARF